MKYQATSILLVCMMLLAVMPIAAGAQSPGIVLPTTETINIVNPGFENGTNGYYADIGKSQELDDLHLVFFDYGAEIANTGHTGSHSFHFFSNQTGGTVGANGADNIRFEQPINAHVGDTVTVSYYVKGHGQYSIIEDGNGPFSTNAIMKNANSSAWVRDSVTYVQQTDQPVDSPMFGVLVAGRWGTNAYFDDFNVTITRPQATGIVLKSANSIKTSWAYYPYDPARPFIGGSWSPNYGGTATRWMKPGKDIYRKLIVVNNGSSNASISFSISGLPSAWAVLVSPAIDLGPGKTGYGHLIVGVPGNATNGTYPYTMTAKAGNDTSTITDAIVVA